MVSLNNYILLGGEERTLREYVDLLQNSKFEFLGVIEVSPVASLLISRKGG